MKLLSFGPAGEERPGVLAGDEMILDLQHASGGEITTIRGLLDLGEAGLERVGRRVSPHSWVSRLSGENLLPANPRAV